jgi:hypothetical protein
MFVMVVKSLINERKNAEHQETEAMHRRWMQKYYRRSTTESDQ